MKMWTCHEPSLEDMLADPIVLCLMARDGVSADDVRLLMRRLSQRLNRR